MFGERAALFSRGQVPCPGLARGLAAVESRWIAYNSARRNAGVLDAAHAARDQTLYAGVDSVERRVGQTGRPRPERFGGVCSPLLRLSPVSRSLFHLLSGPPVRRSSPPRA